MIPSTDEPYTQPCFSSPEKLHRYSVLCHVVEIIMRSIPHVGSSYSIFFFPTCENRSINDTHAPCLRTYVHAEHVHVHVPT